MNKKEEKYIKLNILFKLINNLINYKKIYQFLTQIH